MQTFLKLSYRQHFSQRRPHSSLMDRMPDEAYFSMLPTSNTVAEQIQQVPLWTPPRRSERTVDPLPAGWRMFGAMSTTIGICLPTGKHFH